MQIVGSLHGIIPPICTPLTSDGDLDAASLERLINYLIDSGVHGLFLLGSTGEATLLTTAQKKRLLDIAVPAVGGRVPAVVGILDSSTDRCIEHGLVAQQAGADAVVVSAPYYFRFSQAEIIDHFRRIRRVLDLPVIAYDIPQLVNVKLDLETVRVLAAEGTIVGIKDSSGVLDTFREVLIATRNSGFRSFTGSELLLDACLHLGAHGGVPGLANVVPAAYVRLYEAARAGDWQKAAGVQEQLLGFFRAVIQHGGPGFSATASALGGFKASLKALGVISSCQLTRPLMSFGTEEEARVAKVVHQFEFLLANVAAPFSHSDT